MYKFSNKEHSAVTNLNTGVSGIHPGVQLWEEYQQWVNNGGITEPFDTRSPEEIDVDVKARIWGQIKAERSRRKAGGIKVGTNFFHSDEQSLIQHLGLTIGAMQALQAGGTLETVLSPTPWKTMGGEKVPMTVAMAFSVFQEGVVLDGTLYTIAEQHKAAMEASPNPAAYDYSTGWPEAFEDGL